MSVLFVSDVHLSNKNPLILKKFLFFLKSKVKKSNGLYILGDLFEYWIGDDYLNPFYKKVLLELKKITNDNIPCYFVYGNRDFLIGKDFLRNNGIELIKSEKILYLYNKKILILHGDVFYNSLFYKCYKNFVSNIFIQKIFLLFPLFIRKKIALVIRKKSSYFNKKKMIFNLNKKNIINKFLKNNVDFIIHGHFHKQFINEIFIDNKKLYHICLGDWSNYGFFVQLNNKYVSLNKLIFF